MKSFLRLFSVILLTLYICGAVSYTASADNDTVYLSDRQDLMLPRDYEDSIGWDTAHSGEPLTTWNLSFDKGIGFHCRENGEAYIEFDISSLGMNYFYATVGVLKEATYYIAEGSISFRVYGDGELLASTPVVAWGQKAQYICVPVTGVKTLRLVENNGGSWVCDAGIWGDAALSKELPETPSWAGFDKDRTDKAQLPETVSGDYAYVSDLYFKSYTGTANCRDCNTAGEMIVSLDGKYFPKGVGFHAGSSGYTVYIDVNIENLGFTKFASYYGISETLTSNDISMARVKFAVFGDGKKLFESSVMRYGDPMKSMECDVTGVKTLRLAIAGVPYIDGGWGTWGGALLSKSGNVDSSLLYKNSLYEKPADDPSLPGFEESTANSSLSTNDDEKTPESNDSSKALTFILPIVAALGVTVVLLIGAVFLGIRIGVSFKQRKE